MLIRGIILFLSISVVTQLSGQENAIHDDNILFRGVVVSAVSQERLPGAQIVINRRAAGISRDDGTFAFFAQKRDTVTFTMLGYRPVELIVSDSLNAREFITGIYLQTDTLEIGEVIIIPQFTNLKTEIMNSALEANTQMANARNNITIASYQGRTGQGKLGDPSINYEILRQRQKINAYEKGGIPSDRIVGISPFMLLPAAYLLLNGLPEQPAPPEPRISKKDLDELNKLYLEKLGYKFP